MSAISVSNPEFSVTYGGRNRARLNDGDVVLAGDGITITGTDLAPGEEYSFRVMVEFDDFGTFLPISVDAEDGYEGFITLTSENPTFTESEYNIWELGEDVRRQKIEFYLEQVDVDGSYYGTPTSDQLTGRGFEERRPIVLNIVDDEYVNPDIDRPLPRPSSHPRFPAGNPSRESVVQVTPEPEVEVTPEPVVEVTPEPEVVLDPVVVTPEPVVEDVVTPDPVVEVTPEPEVVPTFKWKLPSFEINLRGARIEDFDLVGIDDLVTGNSGRDNKMRGTGKDDLFEAFKGDDKLVGFGGDDYLQGGGGDDILKGGKGNDLLVGQKGFDVFYDGRGDDYMILGKGEDTVYLGSGDNIIADFNRYQDTLIYDGEIQWDGNVGTYSGGTVTLLGQSSGL